MKSERSALTLSMVAALVVGLTAVGLGVVTGSGAILLDGAFNLCFFGTAVITLRVARLLERPDDARYPFGYVQYEPLINMVKGLLILGVGGFAVFDASVALVRGGNEISAGPAVGYAFCALVLCGAVLIILKGSAVRIASPLVDGDVENWTVNTAISVGMFIAFLLAIVLDRFGWVAAARLVDPALVILVVLLTIGVPIRMAYRALMSLLKHSVEGSVVAEAGTIVRDVTVALSPRNLMVRAVRPGRTTYILIHVVLHGEKAALTVTQADVLRCAIICRLAEKYASVVADIVFTTVPEYAAPTTGWARKRDLPVNFDQSAGAQ